MCLVNDSLMLVGKARNLPLSWTPERCFTQIGSDLILKHLTRLERLVRGKHSSLFWTFLNTAVKSFIILAPGQHHLTMASATQSTLFKWFVQLVPLILLKWSIEKDMIFRVWNQVYYKRFKCNMHNNDN